ncbi:MAG TPA: hypothetical protein VHG29_05745 [Novosphingobium sp.]|nr:hypothetical protein [Novosphingobium sp.]
MYLQTNSVWATSRSTYPLKRFWTLARANLAATCLVASPAFAGQLSPASYVVGMHTPRFLRTAHEGYNISLLPIQNITRVVAFGPTDANGRRYSIATAYTSFPPDRMRGWRLRFVTGRLVGKTFKIARNTASVITITDVNGSLEHAAAGDLVMVDSVVIRDIPVR